MNQNPQYLFQSPSGDSLFSDLYHGTTQMFDRFDTFQSPSGDSLFSDRA